MTRQLIRKDTGLGHCVISYHSWGCYGPNTLLKDMLNLKFVVGCLSLSRGLQPQPLPLCDSYTVSSWAKVACLAGLYPKPGRCGENL